MIYKRGYGKVNKERIALTDNSIIEQVCVVYGVAITITTTAATTTIIIIIINYQLLYKKIKFWLPKL